MSKGRIVIISFVWLTILGVLSLVVKLWWFPAREEAAHNKAIATAEEEKQKKLKATTGSSRYDHILICQHDWFSGYAVLRSPEMQNELSRRRIKLEFVDDRADYNARFQALQKGDAQLAVFTVDALIKASAKFGELPATIVLVIDETRGADAAVTYQKVFPNVDSLNDPETRFVLTADSPSETLVRVLQANFALDRLSEDPFVFVNSAEEVYKAYRQSTNPNAKLVFVLWEPYVSKILENPNIHVVIDSSRFSGYIVDVLVFNRDYLYKNRKVARDIVESYLRANYANRAKMKDLVLTDAQKSGNPLKDSQAENLVNGVWWKNTSENFAHFGIQSGTSVQHVEDVIRNIIRVLTQTGTISGDPTNGQPNMLYYDGIFRELFDSSFHPGIAPEKIRESFVLPALSEEEWEDLMLIGTLEVPRLVFRRGSAKLSERSYYVLDELVGKLNTFPQYYLMIRGNSSSVGDADANKALAVSRAEAAKKYLVEKGINKNRVQALGGETIGSSVTFVLGQMKY